MTVLSRAIYDWICVDYLGLYLLDTRLSFVTNRDRLSYKVIHKSFNV